ncbi:MAG: putative baseplate assembly protein [Anaerolineae bacterium]|jgi:predicted phage baseplate assembly protein
MALPVPNLDDLRFQRDLVDEARRRIVRYCPEWTDYNLSDPGITLIELFSWMTEMIVYRMNRVPEKNYLQFLDLLGMQRQPASSARTDLTFWLSVSLPISPDNDQAVIVPGGTEVVSRQVGEEEEVIFTTDRRLTIVPPRLTQLRREADFHKNYLPRLGIETFHAFSRPPQEGDTFYLGFDEGQEIGGHILQLAFECDPTQAVGIRREDPPWVWECSFGNGLWQEVSPSIRPGERDTTGGLNNPEGSLALYLPLEMAPDLVHGRGAYWLRCRLEQRRPEQGMYTESPRVRDVSVSALGATVPATHAVIVADEFLGTSSGEPNQAFHLDHAPLLTLQADETLQVEELREGEVVWVPWANVPDFVNSDRYDRHFTLDTDTGEVRFGPAVRQPDGTVQQYGRVPEAGRGIRFSRYRYGGGVSGNVPADSLQMPMTSLAYVARVTNLRPVSGGRDPESLDEVQFRARRELRAQLRAVTPEDYEHLALAATRTVARARCITPHSGNGHLAPGTVELLVVPAVADALRAGNLGALHIDPALARTLEEYLDDYRLLTTIVRIGEPDYIGVKVEAEIVPSEYSQPQAVANRVDEALVNFLNPLPTLQDRAQWDTLMGDEWDGWPFGRDLFAAEIFSLIQRVPGVKHVLDVRFSRRPVDPRRQALRDAEGQPPPREILTPVEGRVLRIPANALVCSLEHEIHTMALEGDDG